ncbi:hypothetical protein C9I56_40245 [Paraburkholderia caribensis]|nr:hypothetical protein C9I56_40245 [Paraburkholderia caribensis]
MFFIAYNIATALLTGDLFTNDFTEEAICRADVLAVSRKVQSLHDPECEDPKLGAHGRIKIDIHLRDGSSLKDSIDYPKGNPKNPTSPEEIDQKFIQCVRHTQDTKLNASAGDLLSLLHGFPSGRGTISDLMSLL